eukprot:7263682-Alexandrium_andersonii.AAC.1
MVSGFVVIRGPRGRNTPRARTARVATHTALARPPREGCRADTRGVPLGMTRSPCLAGARQ